MEMNFREWLIIEDVQFIREMLQWYQVIYLGKIGMWDTFSAIEYGQRYAYEKPGSPWWPLRILTLDEYRKWHDEAPNDYKSLRKDPVADNIGALQKGLNEAAYRLSALGFKKYRSSLVLMDLSGEKNQITGGGVGGQAWYMKHAFTVDRRYALGTGAISTTIHEHAHMYWHGFMPIHAKMAFRNWYHKNVLGWIEGEEGKGELTKNLMVPREQMQKAIMDRLPKAAKWFSYEVGDKLRKSPHAYFELRKAVESGDEQKMLLYGTITRFGERAPARLKKPVKVSTYDHWKHEAQPGEMVDVEAGNGGYILNYYKPEDTEHRRRYEYETVIPYDFLSDEEFYGEEPDDEFREPRPDGILNYVEFDYDILWDNLKERYKESVKLAKKTPYSFFATNQQEAIEKAFNSALTSLYRSIPSSEMGGMSFEYDPTKFGGFYTTFAAMVRLRFKKGKIHSVKDLEQIFIDAVKKHIHLAGRETPSNLSSILHRKIDQAKRDIGKPAGEELRRAIHSQGITPSSYAAANFSELWAETVEYAAQNLNSIHPELKKLLVDILSNTVQYKGYAYSKRKPRRLKPRKSTNRS